MATYYRCVHPFSFDVDGVSRVVAVGDVVADHDERFAARKDLFKDASLFQPLDDYVQRMAAGVEQATAGPGEQRTVTRPRRGQPGGPAKTGGKGDDAPAADAKSAPAKNDKESRS